MGMRRWEEEVRGRSGDWSAGGWDMPTRERAGSAFILRGGV